MCLSLYVWFFYVSATNVLSPNFILPDKLPETLQHWESKSLTSDLFPPSQDFLCAIFTTTQPADS